MQQIERYGVIALVFLLVTIVAVSFWGDKKSPGFWSNLTGRGGAKKTAVIDPATTSMLPPPAATERALQDPLPLNSAPANVVGETAQPMSATPTVADPVATLSQPPASSTMLASNQAASASSPEPVMYADPISSMVEEQAARPMPVQKAAPQTSTPAIATYVVQKGDSLARIARAKLGSEQRWTEIQALNGGVDPKSLRVGMKLKLPSDAKHETSAPKARSSAPMQKSPVKASKPSGATYVVKGGDSLTKIAQRMLGDGNRWKEIVAMNPGVDPKRLAVGTSLKLPAGESRPMVAAALPNNRQSQEKPRVR
jgi:nucleoid-associated protein YgaU